MPTRQEHNGGMQKKPEYLSYLLRLYRVSDKEEAVWRASLESPRNGESLVFASLEELFEYLRAATGAHQLRGKTKT